MVHEMNRMGCRHVFADYHYRTLLIYATDEKWNERYNKLTMDAGSEKCQGRSVRNWNVLLTCQQNNDGCIFFCCRCISNCRECLLSPQWLGDWMHPSPSNEGETKDLQNKHLTRSSAEFFTQPELNVFHNCLQHAYHHPRAPGNFSDERKSLF